MSRTMGLPTVGGCCVMSETYPGLRDGYERAWEHCPVDDQVRWDDELAHCRTF
jgi:hypothetical protein